MAYDKVEYEPNRRTHADNIPVYFGSSSDSRIIYDAANDEWTLQTRRRTREALTRTGFG